VYPDTTLTVARERRAAARELLASNIDPAVDRQVKSAQKIIDEATFKTVALEWIEDGKGEWSEDKSSRLKRYTEKYLFPPIGEKPLVSIETPELYQMLKGVSLYSAYTKEDSCIPDYLHYGNGNNLQISKEDLVAKAATVNCIIRNFLDIASDGIIVEPSFPEIDGIHNLTSTIYHALAQNVYRGEKVKL
jgi:hypothetical protein